MVQSAKFNAENRKAKKYFRPIHYGKKMTLNENIATHNVANKTKLFDFNLTLGCLRTDKKKFKIFIPLKRHVQFNKWNNLGRLSKSITITENYVMFNFEVETVKKKEEGNLVGVDFRLKKKKGI